MHRSLALFPLLALVACGGEDKSTDTGTGEVAACDITIVRTTPSAGATNAYYRSPVEFKLSDADPTATVTASFAGTTTRSADGETIVFTPDQPLAPSTDYTVTLAYCGGSAPLSFRTSDLGAAVDSSTLVGKAFSLDLANARIVEPVGIGSVLSSYLTQDILVGVQSVEGSSVQMLGAIGVEGAATPTQDFCTTTIPFPEADFSQAPFFSIGPADTTLSVAGFDITIGQLNITGTIAPDGSYFGGGTLSGTIDTRPLDPLVGDTEGAICTLATTFGVTCAPCADGEAFCLSLVADQIVATGVSTGPIAPVAGGDCTGCDTWTAATVPDVSEQVCPAAE